MPSRSLLRSFLALWIVTGAVLFVGGAGTVLETPDGSPSEFPRLVLLGAFQAAAALLFLVPRTLRAGAAGLLGTITVVFVVHAGLGHFRSDLLLSGVAIFFVLVHGPLTSAQWRAVLARPAV